MSTLIDNLNEIYTTKLQIKEVIGTQSDVFSDYPAYIAAAIGTGGGIDWDEVAAYGYVVPSGTVTLSSNGTVDVSTYANAYVDVQGGGITPTGTYSVTANGNYDITTYASVNVNVPQGGAGDETITVTNWDYIYDGYDVIAKVNGNKMVISDTFWGYKYPASANISNFPAAFTVDDYRICYMNNAYSYTVRPYTYASLPDFNTYRGTEFQVANPYYNDENAPEGANTSDEYFTYTYDGNYRYKASITAYGLDSENEQDMVFGLHQNFAHFGYPQLHNYDSSQYWDMAVNEDIEGNYMNVAGTSYTSGAAFDVRDIIGHSWDVVVDGEGKMYDIVRKTGDLYATNIQAGAGTSADYQFVLNGNNWEYTFTINPEDSGTAQHNMYYRVESETDEYGNSKLRGMNLGITADGTETTATNVPYDISTDNEYFQYDIDAIRNNYPDYECTVEFTVKISKDFFWNGNKTAYVDWNVTMTPLSQ